jgi:hypothetical protein
LWLPSDCPLWSGELKTLGCLLTHYNKNNVADILFFILEEAHSVNNNYLHQQNMPFELFSPSYTHISFQQVLCKCLLWDQHGAGWEQMYDLVPVLKELIFFFQHWGLNSGPYACKVGTLTF